MENKWQEKITHKLIRAYLYALKHIYRFTGIFLKTGFVQKDDWKI